MKPILFNPTVTEFNSNGLGVLSDCTVCTVTEERNGMFELEMQYPVTGLHFSEIKSRCILLVKPNPTDNLQPFRIYRITKPMLGTITVYAQHISYDLAGVPVSPFKSTSVTDVMQKLENMAAVQNPFRFWTDKETVATMIVAAPSATRALLGGQAGSVLDVYGGEYKFDCYLVRLYGQRGSNRGVSIRYGKNLTDIEQDENIAAVYTGVFPYWANADGDLVILPEKTVAAPGIYDFTHIMPLDLSQEWQDAPSESALRSRAFSYMSANNIGVPKVSLSLSFIQLEQTEEYKSLGVMERVELCDTVNVEFPALGVSATAKCVKTIYNALLERFDSIELGEARGSIASTIAEQQQAIKEKPDKTTLQQVIDSTTATILGAKGGAVRFLDENSDGMPDTLYIADDADPAQAVKVWRFNYEGWGASEHGYNGPYTIGATFENGILGDFITAGTISANLIKAGILQSPDGKSFRFDFKTGETEINASRLSVNDKPAASEEYADDAASAAEESAKADTAERLKSYSTTTEMKSAIKQTADAINLSVSCVDARVDTVEKSANSYTDQNSSQNFKGAYPTAPYKAGDTWMDGEQIRVCISASRTRPLSYLSVATGGSAGDTQFIARSIPNATAMILHTMAVAAKDSYESAYADASNTTQNITITYNTAAAVDSEIYNPKDWEKANQYSTGAQIAAAINISANSITSEVKKKVGYTEIISAINQSAEAISIKASKIELEGLVTANKNFQIDESGNMSAKNGAFTGSVSGSTITGSTININTADGCSIDLNSTGLHINASKSAQMFGKQGGALRVGTYSSILENMFSPICFYPADGGIWSVPLASNVSRFNFVWQATSSSYLEINTILGVYGLTAWASDRNLKKNIENSTVNGIDTIKKFVHRQFDWKSSSWHTDCGFVAQELSEIDPNLVIEIKEKDLSGNPTGNSTFQINEATVIPIISKALQELIKRVESIEERIIVHE